jgi:hypothetical protein
MTKLDITPEFLADIDEILQSYFYNRRYKLNAAEQNPYIFLNIEACGYYVENYQLKSKDIDNPELSDCFERENNIDLWISYEVTESDDETLCIRGWWRTEVLTYYYTPQKSRWIDCSLQELDTPCSDGKEFELMAPRLYDCIKSYFENEIERSRFTQKELDIHNNEEDSEKDPEYELLMNRIHDSFFGHKALELYKKYPHPLFRNTTRFLELANSSKPLTDDEWTEIELLWVDLCQRQGRDITPLNRKEIMKSWKDYQPDQ